MTENNVGKIDGVIRLIIGFILIALSGFYFSESPYLSTIFFLVGVTLVATGGIGFCMFYSLCGYTTKDTVKKITRKDIRRAVEEHFARVEQRKTVFNSPVPAKKKTVSKPIVKKSTFAKKKKLSSKKKVVVKKAAPKKKAQLKKKPIAKKKKVVKKVTPKKKKVSLKKKKQTVKKKPAKKKKRR